MDATRDKNQQVPADPWPMSKRVVPSENSTGLSANSCEIDRRQSGEGRDAETRTKSKFQADSRVVTTLPRVTKAFDYIRHVQIIAPEPQKWYQKWSHAFLFKLTTHFPASCLNTNDFLSAVGYLPVHSYTHQRYHVLTYRVYCQSNNDFSTSSVQQKEGTKSSKVTPRKQTSLST